METQNGILRKALVTAGIETIPEDCKWRKKKRIDDKENSQHDENATKKLCQDTEQNVGNYTKKKRNIHTG